MPSKLSEEDEKTLSIHRKIQNVIAEMNGVEQKGFNAFQKYNYTRQEDVVGGVRPLLVKHGLIVLSDIIEENTQFIPEKDSFFTKVKVEFSIIDTDTGERVVKSYYGHGIDKGDKAIYKAITGSEKYFYMKNFLIGTPNDDPEFVTNPENEPWYDNKGAGYNNQGRQQSNPRGSGGGRGQGNSSKTDKTAADKQKEITEKVNAKAAEEEKPKDLQTEGDKKKTVLPESTISKELQRALFDSAKGNEEIVRNAIAKLEYNSTSQIKLSEYKGVLNDIVKQVKALA